MLSTPHQDRQRGDRQVLSIAVGISLLLVIAEIVEAVVSRSLSILSDAIHLSSDVAAYLIGIFGITMSMKEPKGRFSFGYDRAETLTALFALATVWIITLFVTWEAIQRIYTRETSGVQSKVMLSVALLAMFGNVAIMTLLHRRSRSGHAPSLNIRTALLHALGDCLQSVAVVIAAVVLYLKPTWIWMDSVGTIVSSAIIVAGSLPMLHDMTMILMETSPLSNAEMQDLIGQLASTEGVLRVKRIHLWSLGTHRACLAIVIEAAPGNDAQKVKQMLQAKLAKDWPSVTWSNVQVD
jgi:cation diffusion facilitator family transporter